MKTTISLLLFLSSAMLIAHPGHGLMNSGVSHYLLSAIHAVPYLALGLVTVYMLKKKFTTSKVKVDK